MKRRLTILAAVVLSLLITGCTSSRPEQPASQVGRSFASDDSFERGKEPDVNAQTYFAAGQLAEAQGNYVAAAQQYAQAAKLEKGYLLAIYRLGVVYCHLRDWPNAVATWNRYIDETNGAATAYSNLGFCYELQRDLENAEAAYQKAIQRDPRSQPARVNYGLMLARAGRIDHAKEQMAAVLTPAEVHYNLASIYEQQGRHLLARQEYEMALRLDPQLADAKVRLSNISFDE